MATPQTSYTRDFSLPSAGSPYEVSTIEADARINGESSALPAGIAVKEGSTDGKIALLAAGSDRVAGILINSYARNPNNLTGSQAFAAGDSLNMMTKGPLWVTTEQTVTLTDPVYVRHTSDGGSNTQPGTFRKDADSGKATLLKGARWIRAGSAAGQAAIYFDSNVQNSPGGEETLAHDHAELTADTTTKLLKNRSDRYFQIEEAYYVNPTGLAADATNFFNLKVLNAATVAANWSTETGQQGTIAANTFVTLVNGTLAARLVAPGAEVSFFADEGGAATLPVGRLVIHGRYL